MTWETGMPKISISVPTLNHSVSWRALGGGRGTKYRASISFPIGGSGQISPSPHLFIFHRV